MAISRAQGSKGLYANIHAKRKRIKRQKAAGQTPERMRSVGSKGAPTGGAFKQAKNCKKSSCRWYYKIKQHGFVWKKIGGQHATR